MTLLSLPGSEIYTLWGSLGEHILELSRAHTPHALHEFALCMYCVTRQP